MFLIYHYISRRGIIYRGIYLPSLTGELQDLRLEFAYLRYAHRQRQKSLFLVNLADILLKVVIYLQVKCQLNFDTTENSEDQKQCQNNNTLTNATVCTCYMLPEDLNEDPFFLTFWSITIFFNVVLGLISWWRCYANNYLHWGALATWLLLLIQGKII